MNEPASTQAAQQARPAPDDQPDGREAGKSVATRQITPSIKSYGIEHCAHCGNDFLKLTPKHYFCSDKCRYAEYDKRNPRINKVPKRKRRTNLQNKALHKFFQQLADALNESGYSVAKTLRHDVDIPWNGATVKELLWRPVQEAMTGKHSTTEMNTVDPSEIYEVLNRHLGEKLGVHVEWPSEETRP